MKIPIAIKVLLGLFVFGVALFIGVFYVAPIGVLKISKTQPISSASDFGMRNEPLLIVSEDTLNLYGEIAFPFHVDPGEAPPEYALIVLHPVNSNSLKSWQLERNLISMDINLVTFDMRAHGRSEGEYFTLGQKEVTDVKATIDLVREIYPNMKFGIWALGSSGNIALKALEMYDIQFGIIEQFYANPDEYFYVINEDDIGLQIPFIANTIIKESYVYHEISHNNLKVNPKNIHQPLLILDIENEPSEVCDLYHELETQSKIFFPTNRMKLRGHFYPNSDDEFYQCIREFIQLQIS